MIWYRAKYLGENICISESKKAIKIYMKYHRQCKKDQFEIEELLQLIGEDYNEQLILHQFMGYYLTGRDISTIIRDSEKEVNSILENTKSSIIQMEYLLKITNSKEMLKRINSILEYLDEMNQKEIERIKEKYMRYHILIFAPMEEYLNMLGTIRMSLALDEEYKYKLEKED